MCPSDDAGKDSESASSRFVVDMTGTRLLDNYVVREKLADGAMGSVYLAEDENLKRPVVVKVPHARFLGEAGFRERFQKEVNELVRLEHPNIARILAQGEHDDIPFFVLQFLGGGSLEDRLAHAEAGLSEAESFGWLSTIAQTLDFVHARGVVHRDVKPANILFDEAGHVFLSDFGVVKALDDEDLALTLDGAGVGSPKYMAPEQAIGHTVDGRADQYALASTLYESLTGKTPYEADTLVALLLKKERDDPVHIGEHLPSLNDASAQAIMRAIARNPADRFATCTEFAEQVLPSKESKGSTAPAITSFSKMLVALAAIAAITGLVVLALTLSNQGSDTATDPDTASNDSTERVTLVQAGREPRQKLRYRIATPSEERVSFQLKQDAHISGSSELDTKQPSDRRESPSMRLEADVQIRRAHKGQGYRADCKFRDLVFSAPESATEVELQSLKHARAQLAKTRVSYHVTPRGDLSRTKDDGQPGRRRPRSRSKRRAARDRRAGPSRFSAELLERQLSTIFPKEPIGVGAVWDVRYDKSIANMRLSAINTYTLERIEGNRLTLSATTELMAPRQHQRDPKTGRVISTLKHLRSSGTESKEIDLRKLVPTKSIVSSTVNIVFEREVEGSSTPEEIVVESKESAEIRRVE